MKVAVDIDEVTVDFYSTFLNLFNKKYSTSFKYEDIIDSNFSEVFGVSKEEISDLFYELYDSSEFSKLSLVKGAKKGIEVLCESNHIVFVTYRPNYVEIKTKNYFSRNFPGIDLEIVHSNFKLKSTICHELDARVIVEDHAECAYDCASTGMKALLLDKPWNKFYKRHENLIKVYDWSEIVKIVKNAN